jgi:ribose transport system substrate-binding protein
MRSKMRWLTGSAVGALALSTSLAGLGTAAEAAKKPIRIAYISYAVGNSYDAPMLAAAKAVAQAAGAQVTVFDGAYNPANQVSAMQAIIASGKYQGVLLQTIYGPAEISQVKAVIKHKIKVVNIDQILGTKYTTDQIQVKGLSGNVVFFPSRIGTQLATIVGNACGSTNPCKIGLVHNVHTGEPDVAITAAFNATLAAKYPNVQVVAEDDGYYAIGTSTTVVQGFLQAHPDINFIVGADQNCEGAQVALSGANNTSVKLVCYGASAQVVAGLKSGQWVADVAQMPATEGQLGMQMLLKAIKTGKSQGSKNPVAGIPNKGILTASNVKNFSPEWPG